MKSNRSYIIKCRFQFQQVLTSLLQKHCMSLEWQLTLVLKYVLFHFAAYFDGNSEKREQELLKYAKWKKQFQFKPYSLLRYVISGAQYAGRFLLQEVWWWGVLKVGWRLPPLFAL